MQSRAAGLLLAAVALAGAASPQRTIVVIGSSTAAGVGASTASASWAGLLASAVAPKGITVRNVSISGTNTTDSLARFDRDVTPSRPDFVILATSIINEPAANMVNTYIAGTRALIRKVESIGAVPMLVLPYPWSSFTPVQYAAVRDTYNLFSSEGVVVLDFLDGGDDGKGHWLAGLDVDGTHPTDLGHRLLFESIPLTIFDAAVVSRPLMNPNATGSWLQNSAPDADGSIEIAPAAGMNSWTLSVWIEPCEDSSERALLTVNNDFVQLRRVGPNWTLSSAGANLASFSVPATPRFRHIAVTYQSPNRSLAIYLNGDLQARLTLPVGAGPAARLTLGGAPGRPEWNARGDRFADVLLYRAPLAVADIVRLASRLAPWKSVEAWLPMTYSPDRPMLNLAPTTAAITVRGDWSWSGAAIQPRLGVSTSSRRSGGPLNP